MARPREFEEQAALDAAVECFWARGYGATSVRDLSERMGVAGASLYNAFGDKRALYRRALEHYVRRSLDDRIARLAGLPPRQALHAFFDEIVSASLDDPHARGCMLVNAALEVRADDPALQDLLAAELALLERFFQDRVAAGQADGSITAAQAPAALSRMLLSVLLGIRVLARAKPDRALLAGAAESALATLAAPGGP